MIIEFFGLSRGAFRTPDSGCWLIEEPPKRREGVGGTEEAQDITMKPKSGLAYCRLARNTPNKLPRDNGF